MSDLLFWTNVNNLIKSHGLTQDILCARISISINTFRGWVSKNVLPRADEAVTIAKALDTSVEYLVTGHEVDSAREELKKLKQKVMKFAESVQ